MQWKEQPHVAGGNLQVQSPFFDFLIEMYWVIVRENLKT